MLSYVAICYPLKAKVLSSMSFTYKTLAVIWITPLALAVWRGFNVVSAIINEIMR